MHGRRRQPLVHRRPEPDLIHDDELRADEANGLVSRAESIRTFTVLPVDFVAEVEALYGK
ncbi:hypothetical protein [Streptomyces sp. ADI96-02]|uniref:hypothetical protein n=1 Tax=Streptomyces sp. ADI96-02 TaxID=1522760 RepID=UPI0019D2EC6C|nr:hypothetical protein [Streptomyces sp. ADI96-02]